MKERNFMAALDMLDKDQEPHTEADFVPIAEPSTEEEKDTEAEIAAFVNRPDPTGRVEALSSTRISNDTGAGTGKTPFSEVAGFSNTGL
ncbi:hypothetical protein R7R25_21270 [Vibrio sp. 2026]|uniref:hypothetical protein n=1 Tax=Gammaproteobacteria TaxID=1236 RepID=UPI00132025D1|nr:MULTISPECIES: hypothetical protein [Gammaproteobacteria]EGR3952342.1 hypothetical protein [Vibrio cholerae]MDF4289888.1 hypothetical protein [Vibrio parahaemolyticus]EIJ0939555.1 hypothetical protein [Vibrio cholerae]EJL6317412.1 hypothetical protein [Vibrio cholerae]EKF9306345.1 hypothetical protein [Vibrio cholerae]